MQGFVCMEYADLLHLPKCAKHNALTVSQSPRRLNATHIQIDGVVCVYGCMINAYFHYYVSEHRTLAFHFEQSHLSLNG